MISTKINVSKVVIELEFTNSEDYQQSYLKLVEYFESCSIMKSYRTMVDKDKCKISFFVRGGQNFLYESCEELLYYLFSTAKIIDKALFQKGLNEGLKVLDSSKFLFMLCEQKKFLIGVEDKRISLTPIFNESFVNDEGLLIYYKELIGIMMKSLESFVRSRLHLEGRKIFIEYYDAIDQFIYIMKELISSPKLFQQNFVIKDFLISLLRFIVKYQVNKELRNLSVDCNYDHPLDSYRYLTLMTHKLFAKLSYNGAIENLDHDDIQQLANAISYDNEFEKMPAIIANAYTNLSKVLPFKTLEKILKKNKHLEYFF